MQDAQHIVHAKTNHYLFDKTKSETFASENFKGLYINA